MPNQVPDPKLLEEVKLAVIAGTPYPEISRTWGVPESRLKQWTYRYQWPSPTKVRSVALKKERAVIASVTGKLATNWAERGENHRDKAFRIAESSLKGVRKVAVRNAKDLEIVDKIARRAAGLEVGDAMQQTLIQINESIDSFEQPIEAVVVV